MKFDVAAVCTCILVCWFGCAPVKPDQNSADNDMPLLFAEKAEVREKAKDFAGAYELISQALNSAPDNPEYLWRKGYYAACMGKSEEAINLYTQSFQEKNDAGVAFCAADLLMNEERFLEARTFIAYVVKNNPSYIPGLKILVEADLALGSLERAEAILKLLRKYKVENPQLLQELKRRKSSADTGGSPLAGSVREYMFFKAGTVLTGLQKNSYETVFLTIDDDLLKTALERLALMLQQYGITPDFVTAAEADEAALFFQKAVSLTISVPAAEKETALEGKTVLLLLINYEDHEKTAEAFFRLKSAGARVYIYSLGVPRVILRECPVPPDIAGTEGMVLVTPDSMDLERAVKQAKEYLNTEAGPYLKEHAAFYSDKKGLLRLTESR